MEGSLQQATTSVSIAAAELKPDGSWISANRDLCELLGSSFLEISGSNFDELFLIEDAGAEDSFRADLQAGRIQYYSSRRLALCKNGKNLSVLVYFSIPHVSENGRAASIVATIVDLTSLRSAEAALRESETARHELARRLTNAQEKERTRIARELHDDIGQSLAILRIQMLRAGQPVSGMLGKRHPTIPQLCDSLKLLAEKVSRISHQLHSSELEYLGLAVAVKSHCREFAEKYKLSVECTCENIPEDLDSLLALSLLRIVQEALHNAGKYSRATSIQVALEASADQLSLLISDNGVGFDLEEAKLAAGLGLISMRERIHLAGGKFKIISEPGQGTCIVARVPLGAVPPSEP